MSAKCSACSRPISPSRAVMRARAPAKIDIDDLFEELRLDAERDGFDVKIAYTGDPIVTRAAGRLQALPRPISSAMRKSTPRMSLSRRSRDQRFLTIHVDDDGPGIPAELARRRVPAVLPHRRGAQPGSAAARGSGLPIARDIASSHGGDITLSDSPMGGLRATVRVPV